MRLPFSDGWNSLWHFSLGLLASIEPAVTPFFIAYQVLTPDENTMTDLAEYGAGFLVGNYNK